MLRCQLGSVSPTVRFPHIADRACATSILDKARATWDFTTRHAIFRAQLTTTSLQQALLIQGRLLLGARGLGTAPSRGFRVQGRGAPRKQGGVQFPQGCSWGGNSRTRLFQATGQKGTDSQRTASIFPFSSFALCICGSGPPSLRLPLPTRCSAVPSAPVLCQALSPANLALCCQ